VALPAWNEVVASDHVYDSRNIPLALKRLPAVLVYTRDERLEESDGHADPGQRLRVLELVVEIVTGNEEQTDFLCTAVEAIVDANETLGRLVQGNQLKRVSVDRDSDGEKTVVAARMEFEVTYRTLFIYLPQVDEKGILGGVPEYTETEAPAILGMTPTLTEIEEDQGLGVFSRPTQILTSTAPLIGLEHEPSYEPTPMS
jgi:hypothetical protein